MKKGSFEHPAVTGRLDPEPDPPDPQRRHPTARPVDVFPGRQVQVAAFVLVPGEAVLARLHSFNRCVGFGDVAKLLDAGLHFDPVEAVAI